MNSFLSCASRIGVLGVFVAALSACGGGGGGGSDGGGGKPPSVANAYFPTDSSYKWVYDDSVETSFTSFTAANGATVYSLNYPTGGKEYFTTPPEQINLHGMFLNSITVGDGVTYTGDVEIDDVPILRDSWSAGTTQTVSGKGSITISPTYGKRDLTYSGTVSYAADASVSTTMAGFDTKVIKINLTLTTTVSGQTFSIPYAVNFYVARDVGIVKREQGDVTYLLTSRTALDEDGDGVIGAADQFPDDRTKWQDGPPYMMRASIAFAKLPSYSRLTYTHGLHMDRDLVTLPVASSDQSWLTAKVRQEFGTGTLSVDTSADPTGLADGLYLGTVTLTVSAPSTNPPGKVRVALWVGSQDAASSASVAITGQQIAADPLRPYVYVNNASSIDIYNIYTQALVDSIPVALTGSEKLQASSDGSYLYIAASRLQRIALDPPYEQLSSEDVAGGIGEIAVLRPQGFSVVLDGRGNLFDGKTLKQIGRHWFASASGAAVPQGNLVGDHACVVENGDGYVNPLAVMKCYELAYIDGPVPDVRFRSLGSRNLEFQVHDFSISNVLNAINVVPKQSTALWSYPMFIGGVPTVVPTTPAGFSVTDVEEGAYDTTYFGGMGITMLKNLSYDRNLGVIAGGFRVSGDEGVIVATQGTSLQFYRAY